MRISGLVPVFLLCTCAPSPPEHVAVAPRKVVLLTDSTRWAPGQLAQLRAELEAGGARTLVSGAPGETARTLLDRLPWLLQPGVDELRYDAELAGAAVLDSLRERLPAVTISELARSPSGPDDRNRRR